MLAQGANVIIGKCIAFIHKAADLADIALLISFGLRLHILLIVRISHGLLVRELDTLGYITNKHDMGLQINLIDNLAGDISVGILIQEQDAIAGTLHMFVVFKLVDILTGLEAKMLEQLEGSILRQGGNIQNTGSSSQIAGIITLIKVLIFSTSVANQISTTSKITIKSLAIFLVHTLL